MNKETDKRSLLIELRDKIDQEIESCHQSFEYFGSNEYLESKLKETLKPEHEARLRGLNWSRELITNYLNHSDLD